MKKKVYFITIKNKDIPVCIRSYKKSNNLKIYFKNNMLNVSKPEFLSYKKVLDFIKENEEKIYENYIKMVSIQNDNIKHWHDGEKIYYGGEKFIVKLEKVGNNIIKVSVNRSEKTLNIQIPKDFDIENGKEYIDKAVKNLFKENTFYLIEERLKIWSKITKIEYNTFKITDSSRKYGSCIPSRRALFFSLKLIMLPVSKVDAIVVHELCHIIYNNHSKDFYNLVRSYIKDYDEISKWLKNNTYMLVI